MAWQKEDKEKWYLEQKIKRSYRDEVLSGILELNNSFDLVQYGSLSENPTRYPLYLVRSKLHDDRKRTILITGGVHGYETSGVHGALTFMKSKAHLYEKDFNIVCAPCLSPWSYETINRWNPRAIDPNRSFRVDSPSEECALFLKATENLNPYVHFDLHETTDTDNTIFRPALEKRDGISLPFAEIPDGFYLVGDSENPCHEFQKAIIKSVRKVTHIAPADANGKIIGDEITQEGVINYPLKKLYLCAGAFSSVYNTTTEVYPDSAHITPEICVQAQVEAICAGLDFVLSL